MSGGSDTAGTARELKRGRVTVHFVAAYSAVPWPHQVGPDDGEGEGAGEPARRRKGVSFSCVRPRPLAESRRRPLTAWAFKGRGKKYIFTGTAFHAYNSEVFTKRHPLESH